jgi:acyl carrier protein
MSIEVQIREYLTENVLFSDGVFEYDDDASFLDEGIIDSVAIMDFVMFVEETFDIVIEDHEIIPDHFDSVNKLASYIRQKQNSQG